MARITNARASRTIENVAESLNRLINETVSLDQSVSELTAAVTALTEKVAALDARFVAHEKDDKRHTGKVGAVL